MLICLECYHVVAIAQIKNEYLFLAAEFGNQSVVSFTKLIYYKDILFVSLQLFYAQDISC